MIIFLPSALKMLFKETFRDPNVAVSPKKHFFSTWSCKPPELNIQRFEQAFLERKFYQTQDKYFSPLAL